jgi:hypothetical protein
MMLSQHDQTKIHVTGNFSLFDKIFMGAGFYAVTGIGMMGIYLESITWGIIYTGFLVLGFLVLLGYGLCSHCPYPYKHSDCLFPPFGQLFKKMYKYRPGPLTVIDKLAFFAIMGGIVVIPQYWLFKNDTLLSIFWICCVPTYAGFLFYECRKCRNSYCPFNLIKTDEFEST